MGQPSSSAPLWFLHFEGQKPGKAAENFFGGPRAARWPGDVFFLNPRGNWALLGFSLAFRRGRAAMDFYCIFLQRYLFARNFGSLPPLLPPVGPPPRTGPRRYFFPAVSRPAMGKPDRLGGVCLPNGTWPFFLFGGTGGTRPIGNRCGRNPRERGTIPL